jgi:hypothetical protein
VSAFDYRGETHDQGIFQDLRHQRLTAAQTGGIAGNGALKIPPIVSRSDRIWLNCDQGALNFGKILAKMLTSGVSLFLNGCDA